MHETLERSEVTAARDGTIGYDAAVQQNTASLVKQANG
jgi:hypothetical protein